MNRPKILSSYDGVTGVGKTEIARRLAKLSRSAFRQVEAASLRKLAMLAAMWDQSSGDLMEIAINLMREEENARVAAQQNRGQIPLADLLLPHSFGSDRPQLC